MCSLEKHFNVICIYNVNWLIKMTESKWKKLKPIYSLLLQFWTHYHQAMLWESPMSFFLYSYRFILVFLFGIDTQTYTYTYYILYPCVWVCVCILHAIRCLKRFRRSHTLWLKLTGSWEPLNVSVVALTWVLCKGSKSSHILKHLSALPTHSPHRIYFIKRGRLHVSKQ